MDDQVREGYSDPTAEGEADLIANGQAADPPGARPDRKGSWWINKWLIAAVFALLGAILIWFLGFSPRTSTVALDPPKDVVLGGELVVSGTVTPTEKSRTVRISQGSSANGPWLSGPTALTDANGKFAVAMEPKAAGTVWVLATALEHGRNKDAQSDPQSALVRQPASVTVATSTPVIPTTKSASFEGTSRPPGGTVSLEQSSDGVDWAPVTATIALNKDGAYKATVKGLKAGTWQVRATLAQTEAATGAVSEPVSVLVEDYKAAGKRYLEIIGPVNKAVLATNRAGEAFDGSPSTLDALKRAAAKQSAALSKAASQLRSYKGWPQEVAATVESFADHLVVEADGFHLAGTAPTIEEFDSYLEDIRDDQSAGYAEAVEIRDALGLPKRDPIT